MRLVAALIPTLLLLAAMPAVEAADDCDSPTDDACVPVPITVQGGPPESNKKLYVYAGGVDCPTNNVCRGAPPAKAYGLIWEESNTLEGLQRSFSTTPNGQKPADTVILV